MFLNRKAELQELEKLYGESKPKLVILYGRRRVGKTALLWEFAKKNKGLYLLGRQESEAEQLRRFSEEIAEFFNDSFLKVNPLSGWDAFFTYLGEKLSKSKVPLFFDEFPYMVESNKSLPSILQDYWDNTFSKTSAFIILCGSSISMMEGLAGYKSPLYGRRTEQIILEPLTFFQAAEFFKGMSREDAVTFYSVLGGSPAYLLEFNLGKNLLDNIKDNMLQRAKFLYNDVMFVLREELHEPRNYFSILHSVSKGNAKIGEIVNDTGLPKGTVSKYLSVLSDLRIVERRVPITEKRMQNSRKGLYFIKDNYFNFWFRFVFQNISYIEQGRIDKLVDERIKPELNAYIGRQFENMAFQWLQKKFQSYLWGRWWHGDKELDCVGIDEKNRKIAFVEVKWSSLTDADINSVFAELKGKSQFVSWESEGRAEEFMIIAKEAKEKSNFRNVFDLGDFNLGNDSG
ncbi:ATP-binding protein [Candidatus Woesearchaeota archaeon]|nr:ATP-binding protein [Candidatus Woesearchaeota archaeon]